MPEPADNSNRSKPRARGARASPAASRRRGPGDVGYDDGTARRRDAGELAEEGDHVEQDDEVERLAPQGKRRGVGDLEAHPRGEPGGSRRRACSTIAGARSTPRTRLAGKRCATSRAAFPVPVPTSSTRAGEASRRSSAAARGARPPGRGSRPRPAPTRRTGAQRPAEEAPECRPRDDGAGGEPREAPSGRSRARSLTEAPSSSPPSDSEHLGGVALVDREEMFR